MNRIIVIFIVLFLSFQQAAFADPSYAKWGQLAMNEVDRKYEGRIIDYQHIGRKQINPFTAEETFKLWLREGNRDYGVYVTIRFYISTERVISISYQKTDR